MNHYIIRYCGGSYDDYYEANVFVTNNESKAREYVKRFNRILKKWKKHYSQYEYPSSDIYQAGWLKDEHIQYLRRWSALRRITKCYYNEIDFR